MTWYMPEVDATPELQESAFGGARQLERCVALVTPGRLVLPIPCPPPGSHDSEMVAGFRRIVPEEEPQTITVIAFNDVFKAILPTQQGIAAEQVTSLIPFLGYLIGMAYTGHSVVVFEGHPSALAIGCRDADLLLVDEAMVAHLQEDWASVAAGVMRQPRIFVFGRDGRLIAVDPTIERVIADCSQAIRLKPDDAEAYNKRGAAYAVKGDLDRAIADCSEAIRMKPDFADAYNNRGFAYGQKDAQDQAIADYTEAICLRPDSATAYHNRGVAYGKKGDAERAIADCSRSIGLKPDYRDAYSNRAFAFVMKGDLDRAIADYNEVIRLEPRSASGYHMRGMAYEQKGESEKAAADFRKAQELGGGFGPTSQARNTSVNMPKPKRRWWWPFGSDT